MKIHCAVYAIKPGLKASMKWSVTKHVTITESENKDKSQEKTSKGGKGQII